MVVTELGGSVRTIRHEATEILDNLPHAARLAPTSDLLVEVLSALRAIDEATKAAQRITVDHAASAGVPDAEIARLLDVHRSTIKRWKAESGAWERDNTMTYEEVREQS